MLYTVRCDLVDHVLIENVDANSASDAINKFKLLSNNYLEFMENPIYDEDDVDIIAYITHIIGDFKYLKVKLEDMQELFEILCNVPFEITMVNDESPRTTRHPAVESLINQLAPYYDMGDFT